MFKFTEDIKRFLILIIVNILCESFDNESKENGKDMENKMEGKFPPVFNNCLPLVRVTTPKGRVILRRPGQPLVLAPSDWETSPLGQGHSPLWEGYTLQAWQATNYSPL